MPRIPKTLPTIIDRGDKALELTVKDTLREKLFEENIDEFWQVLYNTEEALNRVTDVKRQEIGQYDAAIWFSRMFGIDWLSDLVQYDLSLRVSIDRKGRTEATNVMVGTPQEKKKVGLGSWFRKKEPEG